MWFLHPRILLNCLAFVEMHACILGFSYSLWRSSVAPLLVHHIITGGHHNTSQFFHRSNLLSPVIIKLLRGNCSYIYARVYTIKLTDVKPNLVQEQAFLTFLYAFSIFLHFSTFHICPGRLLDFPFQLFLKYFTQIWAKHEWFSGSMNEVKLIFWLLSPRCCFEHISLSFFIWF